MGKDKGEKIKLSFWETIRTAQGPYRRLFHYVKPYKWRFIIGLSFGLAFGLTNSALPGVVMWVSSFIVPGPQPKMILHHREILRAVPQITSLLLTRSANPAMMTLRSILAYTNAYCMSW